MFLFCYTLPPQSIAGVGYNKLKNLSTLNDKANLFFIYMHGVFCGTQCAILYKECITHLPNYPLGADCELEGTMLLIPDSRRRLTLPPTFKPGQPIDLEPLADGTYRLVPMVTVPEHQVWAHRPEVQSAVEKAISEPPLSGDEHADFMRKLAQ